MAYYLFPLLVFYLGVALCISYGGTNSVVIAIASIPMVALVVLRGHCGTDTAAYYDAFRALGEGGSYGGEPFFNGYALLLWTIYPDPRFVVNGISLTTCLLLLWAISKDRYGAWFGGLVLVPAMFYELTMNVMRFGLAASIFLIATRVPPEQRPVRYAVFALIATGTHFSSILLFLIFLAATRPGKKLVIIGLFFLATVASFLLPAYLGEKANLYGEMSAPNASSGLLFLILQGLLLAVMVLNRRDFNIPTAGWWVFGILCALFYLLTQITYAGMRFQLLLFVLMVSVMWRQFAPRHGRVSARLLGWLFLIGLIALAGRAHNMSGETGRTESPFLPYRVAPALEQME
ncbi:EpsG family protein [Paraburkholderia lycopersici]|uniref:EpsG family protein n=1 Tax=Paraburkholderia lycopersici TaxID=416944 RepID=A0A1G6XW60_9BURK|nr:EpsG family protein [Paraburkholderia lycopersici]SDD82474.1 EpsG family protein [Paraburkholderia lycopersici]